MAKVEKTENKEKEMRLKEDTYLKNVPRGTL